MRGFGRSIVSVMSRYTDYAGRSSRAEFLWWCLFLTIPTIPIEFLFERVLDKTPYYAVLGLIFGFPTLALGTRRLHDTGRTGWWQLLVLVPFGFLVVFVMSCMKGQTGPNQYGDEPTFG